MIREKVIIKRIQSYDVQAIQNFTAEAIKKLGIKSKPRAFIKPNLVMATRYAEHAYTHTDVLKGVFRALDNHGIIQKTLFEDCGLFVPLRYAYRASGYNKLCKQENVDFLNLSEAIFDSFLKVDKASVHGRLPIPSTLTQDALRVFVPKLKVHSQTDITGAVKLNIGIIKRSIRLHRHHHDLGKKIADSLAAFPPDLVITDAINVGINGVGCPDAVNLGVMIASRNAVASDAVGAWLLGYNPEEIEHLTLASHRGLGPVKLSEVEIINPDNIQPVSSEVFREKEISKIHTNFSYFEGRVHEGKRCKGGCIGFIGESLHYLNRYNKWRRGENLNFFANALFGLIGQLPSQERQRKAGIVVGDYKGEIPEDLRSNLIFVGDCTKAGNYKPRVHLKGCPVYMARMVFRFAMDARAMNPFIDVVEGLPFIRAFIEEKVMKLYNIVTHHLRRKR